MKRRFRIKTFLLCPLIIAGSACCAQYQAIAIQKIDRVPKAGIYRIVLPPAFIAQCPDDLSELRIFDEGEKEAPYVLRTNVHDTMNAGFQPIPDPQIREQDSSDRHSYYWLQYQERYRIDRLALSISGPPLYKRDAEVSIVDGRQVDIPAASISIDPADSVFALPALHATRLLIRVSNHDNAPLRITRVATAQAGIYLLAYLEPGHAYQLMTGDASFGAPDYDLHYFTDNTQLHPETAGLGPMHLVSIRETLDKELARRDQRAARSRFVLWSIVTSILLLLIYVSVKLARAVDQRQER